MHTLFAIVLVYAAVGLVFFLIMGGPLSREKNLGWPGAFKLSLLWPATLLQLDWWMRWNQPPSWRAGADPGRTEKFGGPSAYKQQGWENDPAAHPNRPPHEDKPKASYNQLVFGDDPKSVEEEIDDDDVEAFIREQFGHHSAPLAEATTISYKRSGISKTYPAGTMFPDAFLADWKAGFFNTTQ